MLLAGGMAALAGATDVYGVSRLRDLFVSFMSGNTTMLGVALGHGDWRRAASIGWLVALFVAGATAGAVLRLLGGRRHTAVVGAAVTLVLAVPLLWAPATLAAFVLAMGMLNAAMNTVGQTAVSLTYVSGTLVKFGQGLGRTLCGRSADWRWLLQLPMWLSLLGGAVAAIAAQHVLGADALWPLPALAALLTLLAAAEGAGNQ